MPTEEKHCTYLIRNWRKKMETFVVFKEDTKEIIACVCSDKPCIVKNGYGFQVLDHNIEPVFTETSQGIKYNPARYIINP